MLFDGEFSLLSDEQTFGSRKIDVIRQMGCKCAISDFAILLGAYASDDCHIADVSSLKGRTGWWYSSSSHGAGDVSVVNKEGDWSYTYADSRSGGIRPVLPFSSISDISPNGVRGRSGFLEVEYGEYPQYVVDTSLGRTLDSEFSAGRLRKTGKTYTTDSRRWNARSEKFNPVEHEEFEYNGKRYVRVKSNDTGENFKLTNGATAHPGDYFWLEVSPITWLVDERSKLLISKNLLASGVRFCNNRQYDGDFENTEMYMFLNEYFAKEIIPSVNYELDEIQEESQDINLSELDCTIVGKDRFLRGFDDRTEYTLGLLRIVQKALGVPEVPVSSPSETADNGTGVKDLPVYEEQLYTLRQKLMDEGQALDKEIGDSLCEIHLISDEITDKTYGIR